MYRPTTRGNQRSRAKNLKYVVHTCLLIAGCLWLMYHILTHPLYGRKEFDRSGSKISTTRASRDEITKLGRKDTPPRVEEITTKNEKDDEGAKEEKHIRKEKEEEKRERRENKSAEDEDGSEDMIDDMEIEESRGVGEAETNENGKKKSDATDKEVELVDDQGDKDEDNDDESIEMDPEGNTKQMDKQMSFEDGGRDGKKMSKHEAHEDKYKENDSQQGRDEIKNGDSKKLKKPAKTSILGQETKGSGTNEVNLSKDREHKAEGGETSKGEKPSKKTRKRERFNLVRGENQKGSSRPKIKPHKSVQNVTDRSHNDSFPKTTFPGASNHSGRKSNKPSKQKVVRHELGVHNKTKRNATTEEVPNFRAVDLGRRNNSDLFGNDGFFNKNSTISANNSEQNSGDFKTVSQNTKSFVPEKKISSRNNTGPLEIKDSPAQPQEVDNDTSADDNGAEVQDDLSVTSNFIEEKDVQEDLEVIPEVQIEGSDGEDDEVV